MKKKAIQLRTYFDCSNAFLMKSSPHNPIVSKCKITHERGGKYADNMCTFQTENWKSKDKPDDTV